jgi:hypothetical protein
MEFPDRYTIIANATWSALVLYAMSSWAAKRFELQWSDLGLIRCTWSEVGLGIGVGVVMIPLMGFTSLGVRQLLYGESVNPQVAMVRLEGASALDTALMFVLVGLLIPIMEEIFFRGACFSWIQRRHGNRVAIVLSALIFGCIHVDIPIAVGTFLMGLACGWLRVRTGSLVPAICIHALNNSLVYALMLYADTT